jgi:putative tricarboxylic transport membrane protein
MQSNNSARRKGDPWLGAAFLAAGALVIFLSGSIHAIGLGDNFDPGAKAFPIGLSILLILGGLVELLPGGKSTSSATASKSDPKTKTVLFLLGAFLAYVIILPWLGFSITTLIMATAMMILLGNSWKPSLLLSVTLIAIIYLLFVLLFKVPLPSGVFGMPF